MQLINQHHSRNAMTIKKILCIVPTMSIASLMYAHDLSNDQKNCSVIQGAIKTLDATVQIFKSNKQEADSLDQLVLHSAQEINNRVVTLSNEIPKEQLKAAEHVCKEEIKQASKTFKQLFNYHKKNLDEKLDCVLGKEHKDKIIDQAKSCTNSIQAKTCEPEIAISLDILKEQLATVHEPIVQALDNMEVE